MQIPKDGRITGIASISIARRSDDVICITVDDEASGIQFLDMIVSLEDFAKLITGQSSMKGKAEYRGLANLGKNYEWEKRSIDCPIKTYDKDVLRAWLEENGQVEGWFIDTSLDSQRSVTRKSGQEGCTLNYKIYRWVEFDDGE